jgi:HK97 family phage major capsid protein
MSIVQQIATVSSNLESATRSREFVSAARYLLAARGDRIEAQQLAAAGRSTDRVKAAVAAGSISGSGAPLAEYRAVSGAFLESLKHSGAFDAMLPSMLQVPFRTRLAVVSSAPVGSTVAEGAAKPVSSIALGTGELDQQKAVCIVAITDELAKAGGPQVLGLLQRELGGAVALATDVEFLAILLAGAPVVTATTNFLTDLSAALATITVNTGSKIFLIANAATARILALKPSTAGGPAYPSLGLSGGEVAGMQLVVSAAAANGQVVVADASQVMAGSEALELDGSQQATLQLNTVPVGDATAVATSLWQHNMTGLRCTRYFGAEKLRTNAVSTISGIT